METDERTSSIEPAGVMATTCTLRRPEASLGSSSLGSPTVEAQSRMAGHNHISPTASLLAGMLATCVHTIAYLAVTGLVAWVVYRKLGLALLRRAWFNFDLVWAAALVATGLVTLLI
jgi:hypothetical protein